MADDIAEHLWVAVHSVPIHGFVRNKTWADWSELFFERQIRRLTDLRYPITLGYDAGLGAVWSRLPSAFQDLTAEEIIEVIGGVVPPQRSPIVFWSLLIVAGSLGGTWRANAKLPCMRFPCFSRRSAS